MHYLDPERPRLAGGDSLPLLLNAPTRTVLSGLHVSPRGTPEACWIEVSAFFPMPGGGASRREILFPHIAAFAAFWARWLVNPEEVAVQEFGWTPGEPVHCTPSDLDINDLLDGIL